MPERGGTTTQAGIHFQNSVAVLAMLDMLDLNPAPARQRVTSVRVEALEHVDDIVIRFADAAAIYQNVKLELPTGKVLDRLWKQLDSQRNSPEFLDNHTIQVVVGKSTPLFENCVEMSHRAHAETVDEWVGRLAARHVAVLNRIVKQVGSQEAALNIFQRTDFLHWSEEYIEAEFRRRRLAARGPAELPSILRDIVSGGAGHRETYRAGPLRVRLALEHQLRLDEPPEWGLVAYREAIKNEGIITIPGSSRSGPVEDLFVWPEARDLEAESLRDFEDEDLDFWREPTRDRVDLRAFPQPELERVVVVAGPGYGKSALLVALRNRLAAGPFVPVAIPLALLVKSDKNVRSFIQDHLEDEYGLAADWRRLADQGLLVLLYDGLDEIPPNDRTIVLNRIARFSSLHPQCPWLLTARDPAVVSGLPAARQLELMPLSSQEIASFAATIARQLDTVDPLGFVNRLRQYPDLNRLARIPLFLSMLLATTDMRDLRPMSRSDLIEGYLKTLLAPGEHKIVMDGMPAPLLRAIAQEIAFGKIEAQEIGVSETEVRAVIAQHTSDVVAADRVFQLLKSNGILSVQSPVRLRFPYPIVQEYLAACHLVEQEADSLSARIANAISRPWAQVLQFAIERHPDPEPLIRELLERDDDAFKTGLRLAGRCIANGATVTKATRRSVGERLVTAWTTTPSRAREAIGRLLCDAFTDDNLDQLNDAVHNYWLQQSGAGDIVTKINDPDLTLSVVSSLIRDDTITFKFFPSLQPAIEQVHVQALQIAHDLILEVEDQERRDARCSALSNFSPHADLAPIAFALARNPNVPLPGRLRAYALTPRPLEPQGAKLLHSALVKSENTPSFASLSLVSRLEHPERYLEDSLYSKTFSDEQKLALVRTLNEVIPDPGVRAAFIARVRDGLNEAEIDLISALDDAAASAGDRDAFARLVSNFGELPSSAVGTTVSMFGNFRDPRLAEEAAARARERFSAPADLVSVSSAAVMGMLYTMEAASGFSIFHPAQPHPGIQSWVALVEDWSTRSGLTDLQQVDILTSASRLGAEESSGQLERILDEISDPNDPKWNDGYLLGVTLSRAITELRRRKPLLDKALLDRLIRSNQINLLNAGINALSAHGDHDALQRLVAAHNEAHGREKNELANGIELLSLKLSVVCRLRAGKYELSEVPDELGSEGV